MNAGPGGSEPSESDKAAEAALEAAIRRTGYASSPAAPKPVDHYAILGLAHDFTPAELKRRYKKASLAAHPDRAGGSLSVSVCLCLSLSFSLSPGPRRWLSVCLDLSLSLSLSLSVSVSLSLSLCLSLSLSVSVRAARAIAAWSALDLI